MNNELLALALEIIKQPMLLRLFLAICVVTVFSLFYLVAERLRKSWTCQPVAFEVKDNTKRPAMPQSSRNNGTWLRACN